MSRCPEPVSISVEGSLPPWYFPKAHMRLVQRELRHSTGEVSMYIKQVLLQSVPAVSCTPGDDCWAALSRPCILQSVMSRILKKRPYQVNYVRTCHDSARRLMVRLELNLRRPVRQIVFAFRMDMELEPKRGLANQQRRPCVQSAAVP